MCICACSRHNLHPPGSPPTRFGHSSLPPRAINPDVVRFRSKPPAVDDDIEGMLSKLRQSSSKQPLLQHAPPRLPHPGSADDPSLLQFRHSLPQLGPSPPGNPRLPRPHSSTERDRNRRSFDDEGVIGPSDRYRPHEPKERQPFTASGSERDDEQDDESGRRWHRSTVHQNVRAPPPLQFQRDVPRPPAMSQPRGMRPPSLLALSIERPASLDQQQQLKPAQKESSESPPLSPGDLSHPSFDTEVPNQRPHVRSNQGNHRPPLWLRDKIERPPLPPEGHKPIFMPECPRPPRPPGLLEGFRHPRLPSEKQPLLCQSPRPADFSKDKQSFHRPPSFFNGNVPRPSSLPENQFPSQGRMLVTPHPDSEMQQHHGVHTSSDLLRQTSAVIQQKIAALRDLAESSSASQEEMRHFPQLRKPGSASVMMGTAEDDEDDGRSPPHQSPGAQPRLRFRPDLPRHPPVPPFRGPPSLMDLRVQRPPVRPALCPPPPAVADISTNSSTSQPVADPQSSSDSYQFGMSDEPLQFTGRNPPHSVGNSFQRDHSPHVSRPRMFSPCTSSAVPLPGAASHPAGLSDEPLQFTGRMPPPRMQDPSMLQRLRGPNIRPLRALSSEDTLQVQGAGNYPPRMSDKSLQYAGRMPAPRIPDSLSLGSGMRPGTSDEPLQFAGRPPRVPDLSYLPDSSAIRPPSSSEASISATIATRAHALQPPVQPPLGMPLPPFIGMPPPRPFAPPPMAAAAHVAIRVTGPGAQVPNPPFSALRPPVDSTIALPGSGLARPLSAGALMPPRQPFFSQLPNVVS